MVTEEESTHIKELLTELVKEVIRPGNELERPALVAGYSKHIEAMLLAHEVQEG